VTSRAIPKDVCSWKNSKVPCHFTITLALCLSPALLPMHAAQGAFPGVQLPHLSCEEVRDVDLLVLEAK